MKIAVINGPNLNLIGTRETNIYGNQSFEQYLETIQKIFPSVDFEYFQSNIEGELINYLHQVGFEFNGVILNAVGYTHTSVAIGDAIGAITSPVVEVHISNIHAREEFRKVSLISAKCMGSIVGLGLKGYELAVRWLIENK